MSYIEKLITQWHIDRNLIEGATAAAQTVKLLEEFIEVVAAQMPEASPLQIASAVIQSVNGLLETGRIKTVSTKNAKTAFKDGIGDMGVVMVNLAVRADSTLSECMQIAYKEIEHRKGEMRNGIWVKEEDL